MRKQFIKLVAATLTLPIAACDPTPQEKAANSCIKQEVPALRNADGSFRDVEVEIFGSGNSVVLASMSDDIGPLGGGTHKIGMRSYDGFLADRANPKVSILFGMTPGQKPLDRIDNAPLSKVPGADKESDIIRACLAREELLSQPAKQVASLQPR